MRFFIKESDLDIFPKTFKIGLKHKYFENMKFIAIDREVAQMFVYFLLGQSTNDEIVLDIVHVSSRARKTKRNKEIVFLAVVHMGQ